MLRTINIVPTPTVFIMVNVSLFQSDTTKRKLSDKSTTTCTIKVFLLTLIANLFSFFCKYNKTKFDPWHAYNTEKKQILLLY